MRRRLSPVLLTAAVVALSACSDEPTIDRRAGVREAAVETLRGDGRLERPALRRLVADGNRLLDGGRAAFTRRLAELRGTPVVVNQWASWCPPCRAEFPIFQRLAAKYAGRVAFLGVDLRDGRDAAIAFMSEFPTPYPHYFDEDASISRLFDGGRVSPTTGFYNARGEHVFSHLGAYADDAQLEAEIRSHALG